MSKKTILKVLIILMAVAFSSTRDLVSAQTDSSALILSLQKQILQLLTQIQTLQKEVTELKTETGIQTSPASNAAAYDAALSETEEVELPEFTRSLSLGSRGDDVRKLQEFLARDKDIYPEGLATGFYGPRTVEAVRRWQRKNNVEAVGIVGPKTINKFRELGQGIVRGLIQQGTPSGLVPPGLLTAPGLQKQMATATPIVMPPMMVTTTPAIPAIPAIPATSTPPTTATTTPSTSETAPPIATPSGTQPATPATPATPTTSIIATTTTSAEFSNIQVSNITSGSAVVTWTTNKPSDSVVAYTTTSTCISGNLIIVSGGAEWYDCTRSGVGGAGSGNTNTTAHQVTLSLLSPSTHYYYQPVFPGDAFGSGKVLGPILTFDTPSSTVSPALPDLIIQTQALVTPSSPTVNQWATVGFRIQNWSRSASLSNFVPAFVVETTAGSADISSGASPDAKIQNTRHDCPAILGPLRDCYVQFDINYTTAGPKTFYVRLDPQNQIAEANETNNSMVSAPFTVVGPTPGDTTPPTITLAVGYPNLTTQTQPVYIGFNANEEAKVIYEYGLTTGYGSIQTVWDQYWTANGAYLPTLSSGTTYHIRAKATDRAGNIGYSQDYVFTTASPNSPPLITSGPNHTPTDATPKEAVSIGFGTSSACDSSFQYGLSTAYGTSKTPGDPTNKTSHYFYLTGLAANTTYYYKITCVGMGGTLEQTGSYTTGNTQTSTTPTSTATTTSAILDSLGGLLIKLQEFLRR